MFTYFEAKEIHRDQCRRGRNGNTLNIAEFPYNYLYEDDLFLEITITTDDLYTQRVNANFVDKYMDLITKNIIRDPIWISCGKKLRDGTIVPHWHRKYFVLDGNHRTEAYKKMNFEEVVTYIPKSHYEYLLRAEKRG